MAFADIRQRLDSLASRFSEKAQARPSGQMGCPPGLSEDYWCTVQDLFTRDVTSRGLKDLVQRETQETVRFFTRDVDLTDLAKERWYRRYPLSVWRVFLHMAFRLSPARRVLFAVAVPLVLLGWAGYLLSWIARPRVILISYNEVLLLAAMLLTFLLLLELRDKLTLKGDLEIARQIQFGLLPFEPYEKEGVAVCATMRPANTVGGDYFDLMDLPRDERLAVAVGDVAGKGMPAALLMALLQGSLRTLITAGFRGTELVATLNDHLCSHIPPNRLITLFYGEYDRLTGTLHYVNAGHNPPFLLRAQGTLERLPATGVALGVVPGADFETCEAILDPGDRVVFYTDGVSEAFDAHETEYGEERLSAYLAAQRHLPDRQLLEGLREDVLAFCGASLPKDDMTLMVLARARA